MRWQRGYTFIDRGIAKANEELFTAEGGMRNNVNKILLVMTDGQQTKTKGPYTPLSVATRPVKQKGIRIYSLGIGAKVDKAELQQMASNPHTDVFTSESFKDLEQAVVEIMQSFCPKAEDKCKGFKCSKPYSFCVMEGDKPVCKCLKCHDVVRPVCGTDETTYDSECHMKRAACISNTMITVATREPCVCNAIVDVAFIVDSSGSIGRRNWENMKQFLISMVESFTVGPSGTRVAMVMYSTNAEVVFDFNDLKASENTIQNYKKLITNMKLARGYTFIDKGLKLASDKVFTEENGMRPPSIPKIALVITDGKQTTDKGPFMALSQASALLKKKKVHVYALGIGKSVNTNELNDISSHPENDVFQALSFDVLGKKVQKIVDSACKKDPKSKWHIQ